MGRVAGHLTHLANLLLRSTTTTTTTTTIDDDTIMTATRSSPTYGLLLLAAASLLTSASQVVTSSGSNSRESKPMLPSRFAFIRKAPEPVTEIKLESSKTLECEAAGNPPPQVHWLKNGRPVDSQQWQRSAPLAGLGSTAATYYLDCMSPADEGEYTCVATTPFHTVVASTTVFLSAEIPMLLSSSCSPRKKSLGKGARVNVWTPRLMQLQDDDAVLLCRVSGEPAPDVQWTVGHRPIAADDDKYQITEEGDLVIRRLSWEDMGQYTCAARNVFAEDSKTSFLYPLAREK